MFELVRTFTERACPAGYEEEFNRWLAARWRPHLQAVEVTPVGNLVGRVGGGGPRVLLVAHADEIAFAVRAVDERGFLRLASNQDAGGGPPSLRGPAFLPLGHPALVLGGGAPVEGVFATVTGHLVPPGQQGQAALTWRDVWVDIGAASRAEVAALGVTIGSGVIWNPPTRRRGPLFYGKAMDDRAALAVIETLLATLDPGALACELWVASSALEELGTVGAASLSRAMDARYAIALDAGAAGDIPTVDPLDAPTRLGGGPIVVHKGHLPYTRSLTLAIERAAGVAGVPFQRAVYDRLGTDAEALIRAGVAAAALGVPTRYTHSPFEMVHEEDLWACVRLLRALVTGPFWATT